MKTLSPRRFLSLNRLGAVVAFAVALLTYLLTLEPTVSYWDCPEYVTVADRLEIGHPPGNPMWMLAARFFVNFAPDAAHKALMVNAMSAVMSALTVMLLYLTVALLIRRIMFDGAANRIPLSKALLCIGASMSAALLYAWSDTFWFSAVEAEVYAFSSMLTALVLWLALVWVPQGKNPTADRYIVLIAYVSGVAIGVHELNLLCLPAVAVAMYYGMSRKISFRGLLLSLVAGLAAVGAVLYGLIPGFLKLAKWMELLCVNRLSMSFNSGTALCWTVVMTVLIGLAILSLCITKGRWLRGLRLAAWCLAMLFLGMSSYALIMMRASANPPMNQNAPDNIFSLSNYFTREQYGKAPLFYGKTYNARRLREASMDVSARGDTSWSYVRFSLKNPQPQYLPNTAVADAPLRNGFATSSDSLAAAKALAAGRNRYVLLDHTFTSRTTPELDTWFPRLYSTSPQDITSYSGWAGITPGSLDTVWHPTAVTDAKGNPLRVPQLEEPFLLKPTAVQNLRYFAVYQMAYMYWRYFLWNFVGRQNDFTGHGEPDAGNFITGIDALDSTMLDSAYLEPGADPKGNPGRNVYWMLPLLLGILGVAWMCTHGPRGRRLAMITGVLFVMAGVAITIYLNQTPVQARERDYSFSGSFYAFAVFTGGGVCLIASWLQSMLRHRRDTLGAAIAVAAGLGVALQVLSQTADDHDRSGRTATRDMAWNTLMSLEPDAVLFVNGDNYTFPLWYLQEVEGVRTDVRVVSISYLGTPWYASQLLTGQRDARPVPSSGSARGLASGRYAFASYNTADTVPRDAVDALKTLYGGTETHDALGYPRFPASRLRLSDASGPQITVDLHKLASGSSLLAQADMLQLDIVANALRQNRPVYWIDNIAPTALGGQLTGHLTSCGPVQRLTPGKAGIDTDRVDSLIHNVYLWGGANRVPTPYFDPVAAECVASLRRTLIAAAAEKTRQAVQAADPEMLARALRMAQTVEAGLPDKAVPFTAYRIASPTPRYTDEGAELALIYATIARQTSDSRLMRHAMQMLHSRLDYTRAHRLREQALRPGYRRYLSFRSRHFIEAEPYIKSLLDSLTQ